MSMSRELNYIEESKVIGLDTKELKLYMSKDGKKIEHTITFDGEEDVSFWKCQELAKEKGCPFFCLEEVKRAGMIKFDNNLIIGKDAPKTFKEFGEKFKEFLKQNEKAQKKIEEITEENKKYLEKKYKKTHRSKYKDTSFEHNFYSITSELYCEYAEDFLDDIAKFMDIKFASDELEDKVADFDGFVYYDLK